MATFQVDREYTIWERVEVEARTFEEALELSEEIKCDGYVVGLQEETGRFSVYNDKTGKVRFDSDF